MTWETLIKPGKKGHSTPQFPIYTQSHSPTGQIASQIIASLAPQGQTKESQSQMNALFGLSLGRPVGELRSSLLTT